MRQGRLAHTPQDYCFPLRIRRSKIPPAVASVSLAEEPVHHLQSVLLHLLYAALQPSDGDLILCGEGADGLWGNDVHTKILKYDRYVSASRRVGGQSVYRWALSTAGIHNERLDWFTREFNRRVRDSDLQRIRLHDLRHTFATLALKNGMHPKVVSDRLGHASVGITLDLYSHVTPAIGRDAAGIVAGQIFGEQSGGLA